VNPGRLLAVYLGAGLVGWLLIVVPVSVLLVLVLDLGAIASVLTFALGMLVGGLAGPLVLVRSSRVSDWVDGR